MSPAGANHSSSGPASDIFLRTPVETDRERFLELVRASKQVHRPWAYPPETAQGFAAYLRRCRTDRQVSFLACLRGDRALVGVITLSEIVRANFKSAYLGFFGSAHHSGHGYMTAAVSQAIDYAFRRLRLHRIEANIQPANARSIALVKRCGFQREGLSPRYLKIGGRWRDHERWALLVEDWRRRGAENRRS